MSSDRGQDRLSAAHLLLPVGLMAVTLLLVFAFQFRQTLKDRDALYEARGQQQKAFEDSQRLQAQFTALVQGTLRLAEAGSPGAKTIAAKMQQMGIVAPAAPSTTYPAPVPAAAEKPEPGPVKP